MGIESELPRADRSARPAEVVESDRLGRCATCGMMKMTINNIIKCPNCSTKNKGKAHRRVVGSVNRSEMKKIVHNKGKKDEYVEYIPQKSKGVSVVTDDDTSVQPPAAPPVKGSITYIPSSPEDLSGILESLTEGVKARNVESLADFKKRDKLLKALHKIKDQISALIESK